ncbi:MAG: hypothetical protein Fur005_00300 [Roseiflexaceae bacterium]
MRRATPHPSQIAKSVATISGRRMARMVINVGIAKLSGTAQRCKGSNGDIE